MFGRTVRASRVERARTLAGDELIPQPIGSLTHAITIRRPGSRGVALAGADGGGHPCRMVQLRFPRQRSSAKRRPHHAQSAIDRARRTVSRRPGCDRRLPCPDVRNRAVARSWVETRAGCRAHHDVGVRARGARRWKHAADCSRPRGTRLFVLRSSSLDRHAGRPPRTRHHGAETAARHRLSCRIAARDRRRWAPAVRVSSARASLHRTRDAIGESRM